MKSDIQLPAISLAALLLSCFTAPAQSAANNVSMKVDLVAWGESIPGLSLKSEKGSDSVTALSFQYSKSISYSGTAVMEIHQQSDAGSRAPAPGADTPAIPTALAERRKKEPTLVALVALPVESRHVTVLLAPAAAGTFQPYVINDDPSKLPLGKLRIHNLSPFPIAMRCNNKAGVELKPKGSAIIDPQNGEVIYELAYQKDGEWIMQENNLTPVRSDEQAQFVVLKSNEGFFSSQDGSKSGFLQKVVLRRYKDGVAALPELTAGEKAELLERMKREEEQMEKDSMPKNPKTPKVKNP